MLCPNRGWCCFHHSVIDSNCKCGDRCMPHGLDDMILLRTHRRWSICWGCIIIPFIVFMVLYLIVVIDTWDVSQVMCHTTLIWASKTTCKIRSDGGTGDDNMDPCLQSYRRLEWFIPKYGPSKIFGHNVKESWCWYHGPTSSCNETSPYLLAAARSHLLFNESCDVHMNTGTYYEHPLADSRNSAQTNFLYGTMFLPWLIIFVIVIVMWRCTISTAYRYRSIRSKIDNERYERHARHSSFMMFLHGLHPRLGADSTLRRYLINDPLYDDKNIPRLLGAFMDPYIRPPANLEIHSNAPIKWSHYPFNTLMMMVTNDPSITHSFTQCDLHLHHSTIFVHYSNRDCIRYSPHFAYVANKSYPHH
jgi:hypothetical protein